MVRKVILEREERFRLSARRSHVCRRAAISKSLIVALMALLSACAIAPDPKSSEEISERVKADKTELFASQEPLTGELALEDAIARAFKYNMDHRLALIE